MGQLSMPCVRNAKLIVMDLTRTATNFTLAYVDRNASGENMGKDQATYAIIQYDTSFTQTSLKKK